MPRRPEQIIALFGSVGGDHSYTDLVELFSDDAVYYDPFFGAQRGRDEIAAFMATMEQAVPASGAHFEDWRVAADESCGWARWQMVAPHPDGYDVVVLGESLYRLSQGLVTGVVDYVDPIGYSRLRGAAARTPDFAAAAGATESNPDADGDAAAAVAAHANGLTRAGRWAGTATLIDHAGGTDVAWAQWTFHGPHGDFAGWTLRHRNGRFTDYFDTAGAWKLTGEPTRGTQ